MNRYPALEVRRSSPSRSWSASSTRCPTSSPKCRRCRCRRPRRASRSTARCSPPSRRRSRPRTSRSAAPRSTRPASRCASPIPTRSSRRRTSLQAKLGDNYIVALNLLSSSPQWLASIGALPMYLGLDLRGGVHFLLQVDMKAALDKAADRYTTDIRSLMREKKIAVRRASSREGSQRRAALPRRRRAHQGALRDREGLPRSRSCASSDGTGGELRLVGGAEARGAEAHPGRRRRSRTSRSCATA